jgi:hypothetical protein
MLARKASLVNPVITLGTELTKDLQIKKCDEYFLKSIDEEFSIKVSRKRARNMVTIGDVVKLVKDEMG